MKRIITLLLVVLMVFAFASCSSNPATGSSAPANTSVAATGSSASATSSDAATSAASTSAAAKDTSLDDLKSRGVLVLGLDDAFPPFGYRDESNQIVGFDIDLAKEVTSRLGVKLKLQPIVWDSNIVELNSGNIDCIWSGFTITEDRKKQVAFTDPYIENHQVIVVSADSDIKTKADLAGKTVGVQAGSSAVDAINSDSKTASTFKELVQMKDNVMLLTEVKAGTVDAGVLDEWVAQTYCAKQPDVYRMLDENFGAEEFGVGFRKGDLQLRDAVDKILKDMKDDGTYDKIYANWKDKMSEALG